MVYILLVIFRGKGKHRCTHTHTQTWCTFFNWSRTFFFFFSFLLSLLLSLFWGWRIRGRRNGNNTFSDNQAPNSHTCIYYGKIKNCRTFSFRCVETPPTRPKFSLWMMTLKILWDSQRFSFISLWILVEFDIYNQVEILKDSLKILSKESLSQTALKRYRLLQKKYIIKKERKGIFAHPKCLL